jgi:DNA topoisomerase-3
MYKVIITEKPSVAKNIADALNIKNKEDGFYAGESYLITWAFGHLLQLFDAKDYDTSMATWKMGKFPFIPDEFKYKVREDVKEKGKTDKGAEKQISTIKKLVHRNDVDSVISACDYDREGQIIGDILLNYLKVDKPVFRLLLNEWTPNEVISGLKKTVPNSDLKSLQSAGISRQWADWAIGINLTSVTTLKYQKGRKKALNIGRVLLPTLKIIYDRDKEIENFTSVEYYKLIAAFQTSEGTLYEGVYTVGKEDKFSDKSRLEELQNIIAGKNGIVADKKVALKKEYPPYLFNLSSL